VLRPHGFECPQYHKIERALKNSRISCRHPRGVCACSFGCQEEWREPVQHRDVQGAAKTRECRVIVG
jgi:hypothetical protein